MKLNLKRISENELQCELFKILTNEGWIVHTEVKLFPKCRFDMVLCDKNNNIRHILELKREYKRTNENRRNGIVLIFSQNFGMTRQICKYYTRIREADKTIMPWYVRVGKDMFEQQWFKDWLVMLKKLGTPK